MPRSIAIAIPIDQHRLWYVDRYSITVLVARQTGVLS